MRSIGISVSDYEKAKAFERRRLALWGYGDDGGSASPSGWGADRAGLWISKGVTGHVHLALGRQEPQVSRCDFYAAAITRAARTRHAGDAVRVQREKLLRRLRARCGRASNIEDVCSCPRLRTPEGCQCARVRFRQSDWARAALCHCRGPGSRSAASSGRVKGDR